MSEIEILKQFKRSLISFLDELISQFPKEGDLVMFRIFLKDRIEIVTIMNLFVLKILPFQKMIEERNEDFFLNHCSIFNSIKGEKQSKVHKFKKLWRSSSLDSEDRRIVWEWFDSFIFLSQKYQNCVVKNQQKKPY